METTRTVSKYLRHHAVGSHWSLVSAGTGGVDTVVVIPALAESAHLFKTLASLARNPEVDLRRTLVLCVINNRPPGHASPEDIADNQRTLQIIDALVHGRGLGGAVARSAPGGPIDEIAASPLRLAAVDASSPGRELPARDGGVGLARKIGGDLALSLLHGEGGEDGLLLSLDADTLVEAHYLAAVRETFEREDCVASVVSFAHRLPGGGERAAIICYELFLRYYVMGLAHARSPYAFHSIGSTMACRAGAYAAVRGMSRRRAGEDFYFLNKLAKVGPIAATESTTVHPSARVSDRVPFGTGKRVGRFLGGGQEEYLVYDPAVFAVLRSWLSFLSSLGSSGAEEILSRAREIHPGLEEFLVTQRFREVWPRLVANSGSDEGLRRAFTHWFDGFRTMKLIHHLTRGDIPPVGMFAALRRLTAARGEEISLGEGDGALPDLRRQEEILRRLRALDGCRSK